MLTSTQIALEAHMLQTQHQVMVDRAIIVYLSPERDQYRAVGVEDISTCSRVAEWIAARRTT